MTCSSCKYLNEEKGNNGKCSGCCYYCSKKKEYVNGANSKCENYETSYSRTSYECNKIYNEGQCYSNDTIFIFGYIIILTIMIILAVIVNTF